MNLRRWITALAVLAVFTAVAGAQVIPATQVTCVVSAASNPTVRSEGLTERVGDLKLTCTGGVAPISGSVVDRATIVVDFGVAVTSATDTTSGNTSAAEAALVIDEPGSLSTSAATSLGIQLYGPNANLTACASLNNLDTQAHAQLNCGVLAELTSSGYWVAVGGTTANINAGAGGAATTAVAPAVAPFAPNAYQGVVGKGTGTNTQITFSNVPVVPPVNAGVQRVFRIVNVRVNPNGGTGNITATVTSATVTYGASTLAATGSAQVATAAASLTTSVTPSAVSSCVTTNLIAGSGQAPANVALLKFGQNVAGAFKTRVLALDTSNELGMGTGGTTVVGQNQATESYLIGTSNVANTSESGVLLNFGGSLAQAGIATTGTRLKAVFANLDSNVSTYYASLYPVSNFGAEITSPTAKTGGAIGDTQQIPYAVQLATQGTGGETAGYGAATAFGTLANSGVNVVALTVSSGKAEVVWEVTNMKSSGSDTYQFALYAVYGPAKEPAVNPSTAATVSLGYAPTSGSSAPGVTTTAVPRFAAPAAGVGFFTVLPCQTTLLFPFVSNAFVTAATPSSSGHWETGFAIENTGADPLQTTGSSGTCTLTFYGANAPPAMTVPTSGTIAPGTGYSAILSNPANASPAPAYSSFTGYMFAICNFNYGHGFAFITDNTNQLSEGYLALIVASSSASLVPRGTFTLGETLEN